jgi:hypothetical protein
MHDCTRPTSSMRTALHRGIAALSLTFASIATAIAQTGVPPSESPGAQWRDTWGTAAPETSGMKSNKGFSAIIHLVEKSEAERFIREWNETPAALAPTLARAERVDRGQSIVLLVLYAGCSARPEGPAPCSATIDVKTHDPNGKVIMEQFDIPLARDMPAYPKIVQLSPMTLQTDFEASDAYGLYRYDVMLRNPERNANMTLTETILLGPPPSTP